MGLLEQPSALALALAAVLWLVLGVLPGALLARALAPRTSRLVALAAAPAISVALGFAPAAWLSALGVPGAWHAAWLVPLAVAAALAVRGRRSLRALARWSRTASWVLGSAVLSWAVWLVAIGTSDQSWGSVVPGRDGSSHGVFVARILQSGSVDPARVAVFDLADPSSQSVFYPLGAHALAAPVAALTSIASSLLVPMTLLGSLAATAGAAALARRLAGPGAVPAAAVAAAVLVPGFPWAQAWWGPVPLVLATSVLPGCLLLLLAARDRSSTVLAALAVGGLLALHTTEALLVVGMAALVWLLSPGRSRAAVGRGAAAVAGSAVVVAPVVAGLLGGGASRPQEEAPPQSLDQALLWVLLRPVTAFDLVRGASPLLVALAVVAGTALIAVAVLGALRVRRQPLGAAIVVVVAASLVLALAIELGHRSVLTAPWYGSSLRLAAQAAALLPPILACGWIAVRSGRFRALAAPLAAAACVVLVGQSLLAVQQTVSRTAVVTPADRAAFAWLAAHVRPGERVLNDHSDGSVWAYEATGGAVAPMFGPKPSGGFEGEPAWASRLDLRDHVADPAHAALTREEAARWSVRYVLVGERTIGDGEPYLDHEALASSPLVREVFASGGARVYELVG